MKITPRDYVELKDDLAKAGFKAICTLLEGDAATTEDKTIAEVATVYGVSERTVELVKTTSSYTEYETIVKLETEKEELKQELKETKVKEAKVKPEKWHYWVAGSILLLILVGIVWGIWALVSWVGGLF